MAMGLRLHCSLFADLCCRVYLVFMHTDYDGVARLKDVMNTAHTIIDHVSETTPVQASDLILDVDDPQVLEHLQECNRKACRFPAALCATKLACRSACI